MSKNILSSFKKVTKTYYLGRPRGGGWGGGKCPLLPSPADGHDWCLNVANVGQKVGLKLLCLLYSSKITCESGNLWSCDFVITSQNPRVLPSLRWWSPRSGLQSPDWRRRSSNPDGNGDDPARKKIYVTLCMVWKSLSIKRFKWITDNIIR
jgi:hypothetical protein